MPAAPAISQGLKDALLKRISDGAWRPGDRVPSVRDLARQHRVAHATAARVIAELAEEGWLSARPGQGTFVAGGEREPTSSGCGTIVCAVLRQDDLTTAAHDMLDLLHGAQDEARRRGYDLRLEVGPDAAAWDAFAAERSCVGAVLLNSEFVGPARVLGEKRAVAWCGIGTRPGGVAMAVSDEHAAGACAAEHLIALGHRRFAYLTGHEVALDPFIMRQAGVDAVLRAHRLPVSRTVPWHVGRETERGLALAKSMASGASGAPTAVIAGNDIMAVEFAEAAREVGLEVPRHASLIGWGGFADARPRLPGLATVVVGSSGIGRSAVTAVDLMLRQPSLAPLVITVPVRLQPGRTAAAPRTSG